jgi:hypothetical protein
MVVSESSELDPQKNIYTCDYTSAEYVQVMWLCDRFFFQQYICQHAF